jgi:antitoxin component YwqK of YwqJK toxin-antitoxin module
LLVTSGSFAVPVKKARPQEYVKYHNNGTIWAKGQMADGVPTGYWEWFRKDGTKLRSGHFENGEQVGEWTTYDKSGKVYKVTVMKQKKCKKK